MSPHERRGLRILLLAVSIVMAMTAYNITHR